jgi:histidinol phosphatase-like PHP family hydrolase
MILDLHTHSIKSDDGRAKVDNYCQWIQRKELPIDGIVLTEHRQYDGESDYRALEDQYGLLILKASEVETDYGHCLVFGVNDDLLHAFDFGRLDNSLAAVIAAANRCGAFAAPCHPGRKNVGMFSHYETKGPVEGVEVVEVYNGGSIPGEDEKSLEQAAKYGYKGIGGSDSHIVSRIGLCATEFVDDIATMDDLVTALRAGRCEARTWRASER